MTPSQKIFKKTDKYLLRAFLIKCALILDNDGIISQAEGHCQPFFCYVYLKLALKNALKQGLHCGRPSSEFTQNLEYSRLLYFTCHNI